MVPNPIKMDDLGVPLFLETPIYWISLHPVTNSHHQNIYIFRFGDPNLNLDLPRLHPGWGVDPSYIVGGSCWCCTLPETNNELKHLKMDG